MTARGLLIWQCLGHIVPVMRTILAAASIVPILATQAHAGNSPAIFEPNGQWIAEFAEGQCLLTREFISGDVNLKLALIQYYPSRGAELVAATEGGFGTGEVFYRFGSVGLYKEAKDCTVMDWSGLEGTKFPVDLLLRNEAAEPENKTDDPPVYRAPLDLDDVEKSASTYDDLTLQTEGRVFVIKTENLLQPIKVLNRCTANLVEEWGFDVDLHRSLTRSASLENAEPLLQRMARNLPKRMVERGARNNVVVRLNIGSDGEADGCFPQNDKTIEYVAEYVCDMFARYGKYEAALDAQGQPVASYYIRNVKYAAN